MVEPMLRSKRPADRILSEEEIHEIISQRLKGQRPVAWEEDISRNTLDTEPFENLAPPSELDPSAFDHPNRLRIIEPFLGERKLADLIARDHYPIPCPKDREGYSPGADGMYWLSGLEDYLKIMDAAKRHDVAPQSIFDFGCASGRVVRHFAVQSEIPEIWGSDINARHIRWLFEHMPHTVKPIFNHCIPTLPIRDNSIDLVTAFSVFTHIDTFETCWLAELSRILSDNGLAYLTVHNENTWDVIRDEIENVNNRLVQTIIQVDPTVKEKLLGPMADTRTVYRHTQEGPYRAQVFHSNNYLKQVWGRFFSIEEILPCHHVRQTVLVLRKK
jgi:SAM-dependent methyltransferase